MYACVQVRTQLYVELSSPAVQPSRLGSQPIRVRVRVSVRVRVRFVFCSLGFSFAEYIHAASVSLLGLGLGIDLHFAVWVSLLQNAFKQLRVKVGVRNWDQGLG